MSGAPSSATTPPAPAEGQDTMRMRPGLETGSSSSAGLELALRTQGDGVKKKGSSSSAPEIVRDLMVDEHVLECNICFHPLKPPIFQCGVGHVVCSPCSKSKKLKPRKCYLCGVAMRGGYQRCHAMEDVVNSIRGPCPHAPYGCDATPVYHAREEHVVECPHAPCHCPGDGCSFVGSVTTLVEHLAAVHSSWPCTAEAGSAGSSFRVSLRDGFNFLTAVRGNAKYLFLLNMASTPLGKGISAVWIRPLAAMADSSLPPAAATRNNNTTCNLRSSSQSTMVPSVCITSHLISKLSALMGCQIPTPLSNSRFPRSLVPMLLLGSLLQFPSAVHHK